MENSSPGTVTLAILSPKPSKPTFIPAGRWTFLWMAQCWPICRFMGQHDEAVEHRHVAAERESNRDATWQDYIRYSPRGGLLAIATNSKIQGSALSAQDGNSSLAWTPNGTRLLSGGDKEDPTIREWDASTWKQVGDPWKGHTNTITAIAITGTLVASASYDHHVRLWQLSDRRTIAIFRHSHQVGCVTFSTDGKHILTGGDDTKISEWAAPEHALPKDSPNER